MATKKSPIIEVYNPITEELGVIMVFSKIHKELGFSKFVTASARGFDIEHIDYKGHDVTVEFEYLSSSFINHDHPFQMREERKYVVICWSDDCDLKDRIKKEFGKEIEEVICLEKYVKVVVDLDKKEPAKRIKYIVLNYSPEHADYRSFQEWSNSNVYRLKAKFKDNELPKGSKVLIKQGEYIVGGFDVVRYEYIKNLNEKELELYKKLIDYPISLFVDDISKLKKEFLPGHIFYDNFFIIDKAKIKYSEKLPNKKMTQQGFRYIEKEEYDSIIKG